MADVAGTKNSIDLRLETLGQLPVGVLTPTYARDSLSAGMVHIGLGNFHRAHQAWYLHRLMQAGSAQDWAIIGAGVRQYDANMRERLLSQDCLTTLIELDPAGEAVEVIGSMIDYLPIEDGNGALIKKMSDPSIRIVSMTVTEGGYYRDANGQFDADHDDIIFDAANPEQPRTVFGAIVAAYRARREAGTGAFTALSCDNLQGNGAILSECVTYLARMSDPELADWIEAEAAFPNSMVDCIVPATTPEVIEQAQQIGIDDAAPVTHENFRQWVIEDKFCAGRPPWEQVGATITGNVHAYEAMKLRMLNGGHQLLANVAEILSVNTIAASMADPQIRAFFRKVEENEIQRHVAAVPEITPHAYLDLIDGRFANPKIHDTIRRVAFDGSSRHPGFLLPTLRDALAAGTPSSGLALAEAFWARMCAGMREDGSTIEANDPIWDSLHGAALSAKSDPSVWLAQEGIYGDLSGSVNFGDEFTHWLTMLWDDGCRATLDRYLEA